jgi:hypothetical protein
MAITKGAKSPFNICYLTTKGSKTSAAGVVTPGDDVNLYFQSSRIYSDVEVGKRCGITYVDPDKWEGQEPLIKIEQLILSGKLIRLTAEVDLGEAGIGNVSILTTKEKIAGILSDDKAKNLDGQKRINNKGETKGSFYKVRSATRNRFT